MMEIPIHNIEGKQIRVELINHPNPYDYSKIHRHSYFEIFLFKEGGGKQIVDFKNIELKSKSIHIVHPGQVHLMQRDSISSGVVLQFMPVFASDVRFLQVPLQVEFETGDQFDFLFQKVLDIQNALEETKGSKQEIVRLYLQIFLLSLSDSITHQSSFLLNDDIQKFLLELERNFKKYKTVDKYASLLSVSPKTLSNLTKKHLGETGLHVIHNRILLEIKRMMAFQKLPSKEIAYELGFDNLASFSAFVKKKTNLNPTELRTSLSEMVQ